MRVRAGLSSSGLINTQLIKKNPLEKRRQIRYMKEIYERAWETLIFIGNPPDQHFENTFHGAFKLLQQFHLATKDPRTGSEEAKMSLIQPQTISTMSALAAILTAQWFSRTWVLQEALVSKNAVLVCGLSRIKWTDFLDQVRSFDRAGLLLELLENVCDKKVYYLQFVKRIRLFIDLYLEPTTGRHQRDEIKLLMKMTKPFEATIRRDKLYALLGICRHDPGVPVDYDRQEAKVFHELAYKFLDQRSHDCPQDCPLSCPWNQLSILADVNTDNTISTPSWVPDWTETRRSEDMWYRSEDAGYCAAGTSICQGFLSGWKESRLKLDIRAKVCSKVDIISNEGPQLLFTRNSTNLNPRLTWADHMAAAPDFVERTSHLTKWINEVQNILKGAGRPTNSLARTLCAAIPLNDPDSADAPTDDVFNYYFDEYQKYVKAWEDAEHPGRKLSQRLARYENRCRSFYSAAEPCIGRKFFLTKSGHMGLGPSRMQTGDFVAILFGSPMPFLLRPDGKSSKSTERNKYLLVGYCYVDGMMKGEMMERDDYPAEWIRLN